jgi:hypothetical protein
MECGAKTITLRMAVGVETLGLCGVSFVAPGEGKLEWCWFRKAWRLCVPVGSS